MNDEGALPRRPRHQLSRRSESSTGRGRSEPRLILEIPFEGRGQARIEASSLEDELRFRLWLRVALARREPLSDALAAWLELTEEQETAA